MQTTTTSPDLPMLPTALWGHVSQRHPNLRRLDTKARDLLTLLEPLATWVPRITVEPKDPDVDDDDEIAKWEGLRGQCVRLRYELTSEPLTRFRRDVGRHLPHRAAPIEDAIREALYMIEELQAFVEDFMLEDEPGELLVPLEPGEPGPSVTFEF